MKKLLAILLVTILPVLVFANAFTNLMISPGKATMPVPQNRSYRLSELVFSDFYDEVWNQDQKMDFFYSEYIHARLDSIVSYYYSYQDQDWYQDLTTFLTYNGAGYITKVVQAISQGDWFVPVGKYDFVYDDSNRLIHMYTYMADWDGVFYPVNRLHIEYVSNNDLTAISWQDWEDREVYYWKTTFGFDNQGRVNLETNYASQDSTIWVLEGKAEHTYHPQDTTGPDAFVQFIAKDLPLAFVFDHFEYPGLISESIWYYWMERSWEYSDKEVHTYDNQLRKIMTEYLGWDSDAWYYWDRDLFYYDNNGNLDYEINQWYDWDEYYDNHKVEYTWETYTANDDPVTPAITELALRAYPQPFAESMTIVPQSKYSTDIKIGIYNAKGQLVKSIQTPAGMSVVWDGKDDKGITAASGIYFIRADQAGNTATIKAVKMK